MKKMSETSLPIKKSSAPHQSAWRPVLWLLLSALAFIACLCISIAPLNRLAGTTELAALPTSMLLTAPGSWLPSDFWRGSGSYATHMSTQTILFLLCVLLEFGIYALSIFLVQRFATASNQKQLMRVIWLGALVCGLIFVLMPAMISHDAYVYAGYGRVLVTHQANPYFVTLSTFAQDPFIHLDDWSNAPAAYGPLWLLICVFGTLIASSHALAYVLLYRGIGLLSHLLNILLISSILRRMGRSPRTIIIGTLLYAWNPLALQESSMGGHMDVVMVTCMLLGIYLCVRAEQKNSQWLLTIHGYLPPLIAFTAATLIKFTGAPLVGFFLLLLLRKTLLMQEERFSLQQLWQVASKTLLPAILLCAGLILAFYLPFWIGYSLPEIIHSFTSPPSANQAYGSILEAIQKWNTAYAGQEQGFSATLFRFFGTYKTWQNIDTLTTIVVGLTGVIWIWRVPTIRTMILATLAILGALLVVTPWFFPWYVLWIVGLAVLCLPFEQKRADRALVAFTLTFSASAHCIYLFAHGYAPLGGWFGFTCLTTLAAPLLAFLIFWLRPVSTKVP